MLRSFDVDPRNLGKDDNIRPLLIIPGPKQPSNLAPYLIPMLNEFHKLGNCTFRNNNPESTGVLVKDEAGNQFYHRPYLSSVLADSPARNKLSNWMGQRSYLGCGWCMFQGSTMSSGKQNVRGKEYTVLYFMGYQHAVPHTVHDPEMYADIRYLK